MAAKPRTVQRIEIVIKADFSKGTFRINPAAENEKTVQANIKLATIIVPIGASKVPCCDESIICWGARANAYQWGPPKIHNKCQMAEAQAITPALINSFDLTL